MDVQVDHRRLLIIGDDPAQGRQADIGDGVDFSCHEERSIPCISRLYRNNSG